MDVVKRSPFTISIAIVCLAACGGTPREASRPAAKRSEAPLATGHLEELEKPHTKLLAIDWSSVQIKSEADALALWQQIAPTGADWEDKLDEVPGDGEIATELALALLHGGNFKCWGASQPCGRAPIEVPDPAPTATFADPCLRRVLAMWALSQLDVDDLGRARDAIKAIAAIPPPESQLVEKALRVWPENDSAFRLELFAIAFRAGQRDVVNPLAGTLEPADLVQAVEKHHIDGALQVLSVEGNRGTFLAAITDEQLHPSARGEAMIELVTAEDKLAKDTRAALVKATRAQDCSVVAAADRLLVQHGERKFAPTRPHSAKPEAMIRALCVVASYEQLQRADEPSYLLHFIPQKGLELVTVTYDEYSDPPTTRTATLVPRNEVVLPEVEDLSRAMRHCTGTTCRSDDHEFKFSFKPAGGELLLQRLEISERPPCKNTANPNP